MRRFLELDDFPNFPPEDEGAKSSGRFPDEKLRADPPDPSDKKTQLLMKFRQEYEDLGQRLLDYTPPGEGQRNAAHYLKTSFLWLMVHVTESEI